VVYVFAGGILEVGVCQVWLSSLSWFVVVELMLAVVRCFIICISLMMIMTSTVMLTMLGSGPQRAVAFAFTSFRTAPSFMKRTARSSSPTAAGSRGTCTGMNIVDNRKRGSRHQAIGANVVSARTTCGVRKWAYSSRGVCTQATTDNGDTSRVNSVDVTDQDDGVSRSSVGEWNLHFDGGSRGNPGHAGGGAVLTFNISHSSSGTASSTNASDSSTHSRNDGPTVEPITVWRGSFYFGDNMTNNAAEYSALIAGLNAVVDLKDRDIIRKVSRKCNISSDPTHSELIIKGDSLLVINQLNGDYQVKAPQLLSLYNESTALLKKIEWKYSLVHIDRADNAHADMLANFAMDNRTDHSETMELEEIE
jgi:ribonuclease HI